jgi:1-deoxy-D-xylulose-5-phosphate synthase
MDRAGFVGDDGAVHHGFMDQAFLRPLPGMVLMAPSDEAELNRALRLALSLETVSAIRYPRDNVPTKNFEESIAPLANPPARNGVGRSRVLREATDATVIVYGALAETRLAAATELANDGVNVEVIDARFCKPLDGEMLARVLRPGHPVLTVEDHSCKTASAPP